MKKAHSTNSLDDYHNRVESSLGAGSRGPTGTRRGASSRYKQHPNAKPNKRWTCLDENGHRLTGGGIVPYDEHGIWIISEINGSHETRTDVGGKWRFEDIDIYGCIVREWNEETYFTAELKKSDLEDWFISRPRTSRVYVNDHQRNPTYVAYLIHVEDLSTDCGVVLDPEKFSRARNRAIRLNTDVPQDYYSSTKLEYISYEELREALQTKSSANLAIGYRLRRILLHGALKSRVSPALPNRIQTYAESRDSRQDTPEEKVEESSTMKNLGGISLTN